MTSDKGDQKKKINNIAIIQLTFIPTDLQKEVKIKLTNENDKRQDHHHHNLKKQRIPTGKQGSSTRRHTGIQTSDSKMPKEAMMRPSRLCSTFSNHSPDGLRFTDRKSPNTKDAKKRKDKACSFHNEKTRRQRLSRTQIALQLNSENQNIRHRHSPLRDLLMIPKVTQPRTEFFSTTKNIYQNLAHSSEEFNIKE
ncbi:hypothetical protein ACEN9X_25150 [Mucilaginibacter sp. Mucisp86]|uniref:hypothetical protein n=1 Tax=Mucilaginibacter sp. Mucisp86 TaxID=3243060 RepID=UPI0039B4F4DB